MDWHFVALGLFVVGGTFIVSKLIIARSDHPGYVWVWMMILTVTTGIAAFSLGTEHKVKYKTLGECNPKIFVEEKGVDIVKSGDCENVKRVYLNEEPLN